MMLPDKCPKCAVDLRSEELKGLKAIKDGKDAWTRAFLIVQDNRAFSFRCPDCKHEWPIPWMEKPKPVQDLE